ncbi:MAG: hypothetical protein HC764_23935 [Pleurocapsa sp. CRU_1_2]|nr:hypothetical protein [Pleurocapsa sp. CRU_1_2]
MAKFVRFRLSGKVGSSTAAYDFFFQAPPDSYAQLPAAESGVTEVPADAGNIGHVMPLVKTEALLRSAAAARFKLRIKVGTKTKIKSVIVAQEKADTFKEWAMGKTVAGGTVVSVSTPLSASYY